MDDDHIEGRDRPYLSHLDFPTFGGDQEDIATIKYTTLNAHPQSAPSSHTYPAPRLISNFKGVVSDDVLGMELSSVAHLVLDGVERLFTLNRTRPTIRALDIET